MLEETVAPNRKENPNGKTKPKPRKNSERILPKTLKQNPREIPIAES